MHDKKNKTELETTKSLLEENTALQRQLREANESIAAITTGSIDAVVVTDKEALTIYTERTTDKTYRHLIENMNEGAVTLNEGGTILYCNSYFAKLVKLPLQKIPGTKFKKFITHSSRGHVGILLKQGRKNAMKGEVLIVADDGMAVPVLMSVNTLSLDIYPVLSIILTDMTIQIKNQEELKLRTKQLEEKNSELENVNKNLTSFTYVSSHDLQEPLRKIKTFVRLISEEEHKNLSDNGKDYFSRIEQTANRMQTLIEDLLAYSRLSTTEREFEKTDLNIIVDEVKKDFEEVILEKNATIETVNLCDANIIPFQFRQLIHNLLSNALKFSDPEKKLHIIIKSTIAKGNELNNKTLSPKKDYCLITFTDNGIGFDPQYKDRIFEVFQRLHSKEEYSGTGIGLAIVKRIVENHNGIITVTGKLNKGTSFNIYIPAN